MSTIIFTTPCWKKWRLFEPRLALACWFGLLRRSWLCVCLLGLGGPLAQAEGPGQGLVQGPVQVPMQAQSAGPEIAELRIERSDEGMYLSAQLKFELSSLVEDALQKGIPIFFVAEAEINRERWYWVDKTVATASRQIRLAYQPLTRRWRLNIAPGPINIGVNPVPINGAAVANASGNASNSIAVGTSGGGNASGFSSGGGLGVSLNQNFDSLPDALAALQRIARWKVADASELEPDARYTLGFRFRLDISQLARPLQIGVLGQSDWTINLVRNLRIVPEAAR